MARFEEMPKIETPPEAAEAEEKTRPELKIVEKRKISQKELTKARGALKSVGRKEEPEEVEVITEEVSRPEQAPQSEREEKAELKKEVKEMPEEKREKIGFGLKNMGFYAEELKNNFFSKAFKGASMRYDKKSTMGRWLESFSENYTKDAEKARKKMEKIEKGKKQRFRNITSLTSNILRYGRVVTDVVGYTAGAPLRYVMMGGMFFSRGAEAAKEARLKNEEVIEKTRIHDIDEAFEESKKIYGQAQAEAVEAGEKNVSKDDLKKAYQQNIPEDLLKRLEKEAEPGIASGILQKAIKWDVRKSAEGIEKKIEKIESNEKLSSKEKKLRKEKIFNKYSKHLDELDGMVSQYGAVDAMAMGAKYGETAAKTAVKAVMVETAGLAIHKLWDVLPDVYSKISDFVVSPAGAAEVEGGKVVRMPISKVTRMPIAKEGVEKLPVAEEELEIKAAKEAEVKAAELEKPAVEEPKLKTRGIKPLEKSLEEAKELEPKIEEQAKERMLRDAKTKPLEETLKEAEAKAAEIAPEVLEGGLEANFTLELGKGEVPPQLERVFHMMAADHMDGAVNPLDVEKAPGIVPGMFSEKQGAMSLNMAANLVKLAEGNDIVGIEAEDFAKAVAWDAKTGVLEIKDHEQFNQIVDKLENHADELWDKGVLQKGAVAELNNIEKGTWQKIIHAQGLDKAGGIETGIEGHDEIKPEQITDFDKSEMVQEAEKAIAEAEKAVPSEPVEEVEVAKEELPPITEAHLTKAKLSLIEDYKMTPGEAKAIFDEKVGNLLKIPENWTKAVQGEFVDIKHDGMFSSGEYKKYWQLAKDIRGIEPGPAEIEMTIGEYLAKVDAETGVEPEGTLPPEVPPEGAAAETPPEAEEVEKATKEELPPITPEQLAKAKLNLLEQGFKSGEVDLILEKKLTIGKLLEEFAEGANKTEMYQEKLNEIDVPWDGQRGYGEFNRYWKLAERIREELPLIDKSPEGREMTIGDYFGRVRPGAEAVKEGVNIEL